MKFPNPISVRELANKINAKLLGDENLIATGINVIYRAEPGDIIFVDLEKYYKKSLASQATVILIDKEVECPKGKALLVCDQPFEAYNDIIIENRPVRPITRDISDMADIPLSAVLEPGVVIGPNVKIGEHAYLQSNVVVAEHTIIGDHVTIESGTVIGSEAFYFKKYPHGFKKWRSGGRVIIESNVSIGANCTINKGVSSDTIIGEGTKLDCMVHVGHGVHIGKHCLIAAQVGIGGKTIIGDWVTLYGQVGIAQNLHIGDRVTVLAKSGISKDLEAGKTYFGIPAEDIRSKYRELAALRHLPKFLQDFYN